MNRQALKQTPARPSTYWFVLGREPLLSASEIDAVLFSLKNDWLYAPPLLKLGLEKEIDAADLILRLGGTIKIAREIASDVSREEVDAVIISELKKVEGKIHFGLSWYDNLSFPRRRESSDIEFLQKLGLEIKKEMKAAGFSVRYVENRSPQLSSVTVTANNLIKKGGEFLIIPNSVIPPTYVGGIQQFAIAKTLAVQPFEEFSKRDYGRPGRDDVSGMLPPKLAMMMINLAGVSPSAQEGARGEWEKNAVLLDPFCGSGTILTEAMLLGFKNVIGSDISEKAIADAKKNIEWTNGQNVIPAKAGIQLFTADIAKLTEKINVNSIDAIVTEPFLGKPLRGSESREQLRRQMDEVKPLYENALAQFCKVLKPRGEIVMVIPRYNFKNEWISMNLDYKKYGFEAKPYFNQENFLLYHRPGQKLGREIWRFVKR